MKKLFAIMPFGDRPSQDGHNLENIPFDRIYAELIRPVGIDTGHEVLRMDEVSATGLIADQFLREIYESDVVIVDISLPNPNVFYELGIRQAIASGLTLLIALRGTKLPFDVQGQRIFFYDLTEDAVAKTREALLVAIKSQNPQKHENPIQRVLNELGIALSSTNSNADIEQELRLRVERSQEPSQLVAIWHWAKHISSIPPLTLFWLAENLAKKRQWTVALEVIQRAIDVRPNDYELYRQRGWYLRKLGKDFYEEALQSLAIALDLNPGDTEALGMIGGILKRQGKFNEAAQYYAKGVKIAPNALYMKVAYAGMAVLSKLDDPSEGLELYNNLLGEINSLPPEDIGEWEDVVRAEAAFALGDETSALKFFNRAFARLASNNTIVSALDQIELMGQMGFRREASQYLVRTIRPRILGINKDEISFPDSRITQSVIQEELPIIIHLSDIHFGSIEKNGKQIEMHRFYDGEYSRLLSSHLINEFSSSKGYFQYNHERLYLVVSGDLVYKGTSEEFDRALDCLNEICSGLGISKQRVVITPGNHDINWHAADADVTHRFDSYLVFLHKFYENDLFHELYPQIKWDFRVDQKRPEPSDLVSVRSFLDGRFILTSFNSCIYETHQHHYGFVGGKQLRHISDKLASMNISKDAVSVAVMHHHLHPFPEMIERQSEEVWIDVSTIRDSGLVEKNLEKLGFDIVLHGHKHKPQLRETLIRNYTSKNQPSKSLIICGAGSSGVAANELEPGQSNHYQVLELLNIPRVRRADFLRVEWRNMELTTDADWRTHDAWTIEG